VHTFSVWAPRAGVVSVLVNGQSYPMMSQPHGWWTADVASAEHGVDYAFLLDDDPKPYPDPRSGWQPAGVHGPSRVLDHRRYVWKDAGFQPTALSDAVIYELHIGTFTPEGTFDAAAEKLLYLRELGITHVELMPVNSFPGRWGWGYDGVDLFAPQEAYGGPEALKHFVDQCHSLGLSVLLDVVYNHFGPDGNYTGRFGPYITENHHTPWGGAVNLEEYGSDEVRHFFCDNALMWLRDYHFNGLRLDAVHSLVDRSAVHFLEQLSEEVESLSNEIGKDLVLIAESDLNDPRVVTPRASKEGVGNCGYGIDAQWSDDFHHALFAFLTGERRSYYRDFGSLKQLAKALTSIYVFDDIYSEYRGRNHGRPVENLGAHRFLGYIQNHDQVGNRAFGDRLHEEAGIKAAKLAAALVLTAPFVPMIFQGEEFAASSPFLYFADHEDPELARAVSEGRRREHAPDGDWESIPDPESQETFERSKLNWSERESGSHAEMLAWYRSLIDLRRSHACLRDERLSHTRVRFDEAARWLIMERVSEQGSLHMLFNFSDEAIQLEAPEKSRIVLASATEVQSDAGTVYLPPQTFAAIVADPRERSDS
jgi:maltooligosyltrehalose trehalohydrolase